ncbi:MAG: hypothetical protein CTY19_04450 [Methylomonas sp.]|nr:MAG: hypothetical protein CTY19_04450 [Methylomonas sp.]
MKLCKLCVLWFGLVWLLILPAQAAPIQASVNRNPVNLNESLQITFSASETPDGNPDFTPLKENFQILNQQRSSNMSWINGKASHNEQWIVNVIPKQAGELLIPPIAFGNDSSQPLTLKVNQAPPVQPNSNAEVFLDVQASPENPYVQSQVLYTLKLYRRVQITQASLNEPEIKDAVVEKLGEDNTYSTQVNGEDYWVTERKYAIFPQQSGLFTIAPLTLTAEVVSEQRPQFNGFFNRQITETRRVSSKAITLSVQAPPASFTDPAWLSAESLQLNETWSSNDLKTKVGEPLTRTITLIAKGSTVGQLPELSKPLNMDGIKTYPDQPVLYEDKQSDGLIAHREEKIAYIPSQPGQYTLPAVNISWFNTQTQQIETAQLPAVTLQTLEATAQPATNPAQQPQTPVAPTLSSQPTNSEPLVFWQWLSAALALGWLSHVAWLYRSARNKPAAAEAVEHPTQQAADMKALKSACLQNQAQAAKQALLLWGRQQFAEDNLTAIAGQCPEPLRTEILLLNQALYSAALPDWNGNALWEAFIQCKPGKTKAANAAEEVLEPLYRL